MNLALHPRALSWAIAFGHFGARALRRRDSIFTGITAAPGAREAKVFDLTIAGTLRALNAGHPLLSIGA
ncbi:MAG: hypothetical protein ABIQ99_07690 [Thermoflexales bacterium]